VREAERGGMENLRAAVAAAAGVGRGTIATRTRNRPVFSMDDQTGVVVWCGVLSGSMADGTATRC